MPNPTTELKETVNQNPFSESGTSPPVHKAAELFPMMDEKELMELASDIQKNGQQEPIMTHPETGEVIDGRNRLKACQLIGIEPRYQAWTGSGSVVNFVISKNIHRRHLNNHERTVIAERLIEMFSKEAQVRQKNGRPSEDKGDAAAKAAAVMNVPKRGVEKVKKVRVNGTENVNAALDAHIISIGEADQIASLSPQQQDEVILVKDKKDRQKKLSEIKSTQTPNTTEDDRLNESVRDIKKSIKKLGEDLNTLCEDEARCLEQELKALRDVVAIKLKLITASPIEGGKNE